MKRHYAIHQHMESVTQLSLFEDKGTSTASSHAAEARLQALQHLESETTSTESKEAYERGRVAELAEKLGWPAMRMEAVRHWAGVTIPEGANAWHDFLAQETSSGTIGLLLLALHWQLDPLTYESINEETGLHCCPVEVISQVEERLRRRMIHLANVLDWPRVSYWAANKVEMIGPGEGTWQTYFVYGSFGHIADAVGALERRLCGELDKVSRTSLLASGEEDEGKASSVCDLGTLPESGK